MAISRHLTRLSSLVINRYVILITILLTYTGILQNYGGLPSFSGAWRFEIPLILYLYFYLNTILRPTRWQPLLAAAPLVLIYVGFDIYFILFGRLPHITEVTELPEMFEVLPVAIDILVVLIVASPMALIVASIDYKKTRALLLGALPLTAIVANIEVAPESFMEAFKETQLEIIFYSDAHSTRNVGRLGMMLYNEARRKSYLQKIAAYRDNARYREQFNSAADSVKAQKDKRNVHLIVLESFLDPSLIKGAQFTPSPVDPGFDKLFHNKSGFSIAPVFAGGTAQSEFEVLCGVPALRELSGIEFNVFTGTKTYCLPHLLSQGGYQTTVTNSFVPDFYNSTNAYAGIGFDKIYFPQEYAVARDTYFSNGDVTDEMYIFDGVLLSQNLAYISKQIKEQKDTPIFNYILSIYGHTPHGINTDKRPKVITVDSSLKDEQLTNSINQFHYRTKAIAEYINALIQVDPKSLIILVSDHLPALTYGPNSYKELQYLDGGEEAIHMNRIYIIEDGVATQYNTIHHYDIPRIVLNYITKGEYCQGHACTFKTTPDSINTATYRDEYMTIMAEAMGGCEPPPPQTGSDHDEDDTPAQPNPQPGA